LDNTLIAVTLKENKDMKLGNGCGCSAAIRVLLRIKLEEYNKAMHSLSHYDSSTFTQKNSIFSDFMLFVTDPRS